MKSDDLCGIYVHIPFCVRKCSYCDFLSAPAGETTRAGYVRQLLKELEAVISVMRQKGERIRTVYLGGGTPSVLKTEELCSIVHTLLDNELVLPDCEVTMEVNPGTVDHEKLAAVHEAGVNRLSMGVQSFQPEELKLLGRIHTAEEAKACFLMAREAGFQNLSIDLMSGLPGQTEETFADTLQQALALRPEHISAYSLIIEPGTPFYETYGEHFSEEVEETDRRLYDLTRERLSQAGYYRYEISNYALPGFESRHNSGYWTGSPYYGCGLGASSLLHMGERYYRTVNPDTLKDYLAADFKKAYVPAKHGYGQTTEKPGSDRTQTPLLTDYYIETELLSTANRMEEFMFLGLRMTKGISSREFFERFQRYPEEIFGDALQKLSDEKLLEKTDLGYKLTDKGLDLSNYCFTYFLLD